VYVGRGSKWGNPYKVSNETTPEEAVRLFKKYIKHRYWLNVDDLWGKNLACWCPLDQPCHADVLLELANEEIEAIT